MARPLLLGSQGTCRTEFQCLGGRQTLQEFAVRTELNYDLTMPDSVEFMWMAESIDSDCFGPYKDAQKTGQSVYFYRCKQGCILADVDGTPIILSPSLEYVRIDKIGADIVKQIFVEWQKIDSIVLEISEEYEGIIENIKVDVKAYLDSLIGLGVVEARESSIETFHQVPGIEL